MLKKALIIYNSASGNQGFYKHMDEVVAVCHRFGYLPTFYRIDPAQTHQQVFKMVEQYQVVFICGGDGTIGRVVDQLLHTKADMPVGIIPAGTANDFATALALEKDPGTAVAGLLAGDLLEIDMGMVNDRHFINVAGAGILTTISQEVDNAIKSRLGVTGYYLRGLEHIRRAAPMPVTIEGDNFKINEEIMLFLVLNSTTAGSIKNIAPHAKITDGLLDVVLLKKCPPVQLVPLLMRVYEGKGAHLSHPLVEHHQTRWVKVTAGEDIISIIDGEIGPPLPLNIRVLPGRLKLLVPRLN